MSQTALIDLFTEHFANRQLFSSIAEARRHAAFILGTPVLSGTAPAKQVDEAIEAGAIRASRYLAKQAKTPQEAYRAIVNLYAGQPSLTVRSSTSVANQAYSTPVPLAYLTAHLAGIEPSTSVYEPCSGNGSLLINASPGMTTVNELDPTRADTLRSQGFMVTENDALSYVPDQHHDVVITNPPFGTIPSDTGGKRLFTIKVDNDELQTTRIEHAIVLNSLKAMKPDGRAVFIIDSEQRGQQKRSKHYSTGQNQNFFQLLYKHYNVKKHFTVSRKLYRKQGADVPVDIIVIHGKGVSQRSLPEHQIPHIYESFEELGTLIQNVRQVQEAIPPGTSICSVEDAKKLLHQGNALKTVDNQLTITPQDGGQSFVMTTPRKTQTGGRYFLDHDLLSATGADFYSLDDRMKNTVTPNKLEAALRVFFDKDIPLLVTDVPEIKPSSQLRVTGDWTKFQEQGPLFERHPMTQEQIGHTAIIAARKMLDVVGIQHDKSGRRSLSGKKYRVDESPLGVTIYAHNRGVIASLQNGQLTTNLTPQDYTRFLDIAARLGKPHRYQSMRSKSLSVKQRVIKALL